MTSGKIAVVDYDGTLVEHQFPLHGPALPGAREGLALLKKHGWHVRVSSCRTNPDISNSNVVKKIAGNVHAGFDARLVAQEMRANLWRNGMTVDEIVLERGKPYGDLYIDDRAIHWGGWEQASLEIVARSRGVSLKPKTKECFCALYGSLLREVHGRVAQSATTLASELSATSDTSLRDLGRALRELEQVSRDIADSPVAVPEVLHELTSDGQELAHRVVRAPTITMLTRVVTAMAQELSSSGSSRNSSLPAVSGALQDILRLIATKMPRKEHGEPE